ncbi:hypothetical protein [Pseudoxanthomonas sp. PXM01]|uniref:hypothetical protein n=1 Tax=Pseudoxanthomonas sp. PXM01 TaxID=2769295 RepID=UPI001781F871|nr:hypothetical protein [Pseudoxanthomonas sp. PXM01]MBD9470377.1 hypothetical protein [Pseudoxanthomonas sp. PXM01]
MTWKGVRSFLGVICVTAVLLALLTGCDQLGASLGMPVERKQESAPASQTTIISEPVSANDVSVAPEEGPGGIAEWSGAPPEAADEPVVVASTDLPPDGPEYQADLLEVQAAARTGNQGRLVGVPTQVSANGYPVYPANCSFYPDHAECALASGEVVDEAYLQAHTTVIRNLHVLHGGMTCGIVCVDDDGNVLGHVSQAMQAWREANCRWEQYGMARCR